MAYSLVLCCSASNMKSPQSKPVRLLQEKFQENLESMLKVLLKDEVLSDITIHCNDGFVRAHRVVLAAFSSYFKKVFQEHPEHQVAYILHGINVEQLKSLVELIYSGSTEIPSDKTGALCDIAEEFGIKPIIDENDKNLSGTPSRDTRFRGQKRVAVDFENASLENPDGSTNLTAVQIKNEPIVSPESETPSNKMPENFVIPSANCYPASAPSPNCARLATNLSMSESNGFSISSLPLNAEARRKSNWALKQRKYKCTLCSSSFKRASHLSRHQLVHTGERPFACDQCDKAFSRHDKLKNHIRKTHSLDYPENISDSVPEEKEVYTMGHVRMNVPHSETSEELTRVTREDLLVHMTKSEQYFEPETTATDEPVLPVSLPNTPPKKGRGRPRKYPPVTVPLIKRPRGRPRLNPDDRAGLRFKRRREDESPERPDQEKPTNQQRENYDLTNMPFGDLDYLTKRVTMTPNPEKFEETNSSDQPYIEPLIEIECGQGSSKQIREEEEEEDTVLHHHTAGAFLQNIGLLETSVVSKMEIGETTISVSKTESISK
ncbi:zinc finger and BTB domain-containing protein 8A isoform X1 [Dendroctonus ponderosae]|uniref:zinc finger and BTB domain-containing protein 8A isoform X1 n=2 Tax=Dendroctonus ponderosae TaxID=77166 RepID=UPI00203659E8|nr:zinc finger and BTB domain-containing protein 8A isoform X1 [Dendroctonus ponderosae]